MIKTIKVNNDEQFIESMHELRMFLNNKSPIFQDTSKVVNKIKQNNGDIQMFYGICKVELTDNFKIELNYQPEDNTYLLSNDVNDHTSVINSAIMMFCEENHIYYEFD